MSDDLIEALRLQGWDEQADLIEQLEREQSRLHTQCDGLMQAGMNNGQALILAEAKLAKAVEFIQEVRRNGYPRLAFMAIAVLAELEGK